MTHHDQPPCDPANELARYLSDKAKALLGGLAANKPPELPAELLAYRGRPLTPGSLEARLAALMDTIEQENLGRGHGGMTHTVSAPTVSDRLGDRQAHELGQAIQWTDLDAANSGLLRGAQAVRLGRTVRQEERRGTSIPQFTDRFRVTVVFGGSQQPSGGLLSDRGQNPDRLSSYQIMAFGDQPFQGVALEDLSIGTFATSEQQHDLMSLLVDDLENILNRA
ncbi:MAG TPA: hypothetical protein VLF40_06435 [Candidatus Saccharimonadales bacterium]|nr:hypothetical protein [Candidatus Saccharimonadales bacterium]